MMAIAMLVSLQDCRGGIQLKFGPALNGSNDAHDDISIIS